MRILLPIFIFLLCFGSIVTAGYTSVFKGVYRAIAIMRFVERTYSDHKMHFQEEVAPEVYKMLLNLKREFDHIMYPILEDTLKGDYEHNIEAPTSTLFRSIELFFRHPSESSLDDMKAICMYHNPMRILLEFEQQLNRTDSVYFKYLKLYNFASSSSNMLMKQFEGIVAKLVIAHGICRNFTANGNGETAKHVSEVAILTINLIRKQRKEVPNLLTPNIVLHHLSTLRVPHCFDKAAKDWVKNYDYAVVCTHKATRNSSTCKVEYRLSVRKIIRDTLKGIPHKKPSSCVQNINHYIRTNLAKTYDYGKIWTVHTSVDPFIGKKEGNVVEYEVGPLTVLIYFSNPPKTRVLMPLEEIEENLLSRVFNFFEMFRFWDRLCPYPWGSEIAFAENFYNKIRYNNYCGNRNLCVIGTERHVFSLKGSNTDLSFVAPCVGRDFIPIIMGPEEGQEKEYPPGDKLKMEDPFKWLNKLGERMKNLRNEYNEEIKRTARAIKQEIQLEELTERIAESYK